MARKFKLGPIQKKWIKSLKEHPERQMSGQLGRQRNGSYKACCLGEGGIIAGVCKWEGNILVTAIGHKMYALEHGSYKKLGLRDSLGETLQSYYYMPTLADMNDEGMKWYEIAAILEVFPEVYFNKSV